MEHLNENLNETKRGENKSNEQKSALLQYWNVIKPLYDFFLNEIKGETCIIS